MRLEWDADTTFPISVEMVKHHCRVTGAQLDPLIAALHLPAAVQWAEGEMHRSILPKVHRWSIEHFPFGRSHSIRLPRGKTQSVTSIAYVSGGNVITLRGPSSGSPIGTDWQENLIGDSGGILIPPRGGNWPTADCDAPSPVTITFVAGWSTPPVEVLQAICIDVQDRLDGTDTAVKSTILSSLRIIR